MKCLFFVLLLAAATTSCTFGQTLRNEIISSDLAQRFGLKRAWVAQAQIHRGMDRIIGAALDGDALCLLSERGLVELLDAELGTARWLVQLGNVLYSATGPGIGENYVAITKGSTLYVVERATGKQIFEKRLQQVADAAPAIWQKHVYVPLFNGMLSAYDLSNPRAAPWFYRASGNVDVPPIVNAQTLAWATSRGYVYATNPDKLDLRFQFQANAEITAPLAYSTPYLFIASRDGFVYAVNEKNGHMLWRFAIGDAISKQPAVIGGNVFVVPESGGMFCLSEKSGLQRWHTPRVRQFVAASPRRQQNGPAGQPPPDAQLARVYAADETGNLMILDAGSGTRLATMPASSLTWKFTNLQNDRLYLGTNGGLVQCLHEIGLDQPTNYVKTKPAPTAATDGEKPATTEEAEPTDGQPAENPDENPFEAQPSP